MNSFPLLARQADAPQPPFSVLPALRKSGSGAEAGLLFCLAHIVSRSHAVFSVTLLLYTGRSCTLTLCIAGSTLSVSASKSPVSPKHPGMTALDPVAAPLEKSASRSRAQSSCSVGFGRGALRPKRPEGFPGAESRQGNRRREKLDTGRAEP